jgi:SAM-dependent methyltransferase
MSTSLNSFYSDHYARLDRPDLSRDIRINLAAAYISRFVANRDVRLLELGCGVGTSLIRIRQLLKGREFTLIGTDISKEAVNAARGLGIDAFKVDLNADRLPVQDESVDVVLFLEVIEHLYNSDNIMEEIRRILKSKGLLVISTPNLASWANRAAILLGFQPFSHDVSLIRGFGQARVSPVNGHLKAFTRRALLEYVRYFGFRIVDEGVTPAGGVEGLASLADRVFSRLPSLASHTVLACCKQ